MRRAAVGTDLTRLSLASCVVVERPLSINDRGYLLSVLRSELTSGYLGLLRGPLVVGGILLLLLVISVRGKPSLVIARVGSSFALYSFSTTGLVRFVDVLGRSGAFHYCPFAVVLGLSDRVMFSLRFTDGPTFLRCGLGRSWGLSSFLMYFFLSVPAGDHAFTARVGRVIVRGVQGAVGGSDLAENGA